MDGEPKNTSGTPSGTWLLDLTVDAPLRLPSSSTSLKGAQQPHPFSFLRSKEPFTAPPASSVDSGQCRTSNMTKGLSLCHVSLCHVSLCHDRSSAGHPAAHPAHREVHPLVEKIIWTRRTPGRTASRISPKSTLAHDSNLGHRCMTRSQTLSATSPSSAPLTKAIQKSKPWTEARSRQSLSRRFNPNLPNPSLRH